MNHFLRNLFFLGIVRPLVVVVIGLRLRRRELLPRGGPAFVVANHNSHLDALVLMSIFPRRQLAKVRPVAAADYFFRNKWLSWFALQIIGVLPIDRTLKGARSDPLAGISESVDRSEIVILFPEGSRGEPEQLDEFKAGIAHLAKRHPTVPVIPVFLHGLGKSLPRGEALLVPFFCDIFVGESISWQGNRAKFMEELFESIEALGAEMGHSAWT